MSAINKVETYTYTSYNYAFLLFLYQVYNYILLDRSSSCLCKKVRQIMATVTKQGRTKKYKIPLILWKPIITVKIEEYFLC